MSLLAGLLWSLMFGLVVIAYAAACEAAIAALTPKEPPRD